MEYRVWGGGRIRMFFDQGQIRLLKFDLRSNLLGQSKICLTLLKFEQKTS